MWLDRSTPWLKLPRDLPQPHSLCKDTLPVPCLSHSSSATALRKVKVFTCSSNTEPDALYTSPPKDRGLCLQFGSKRKGGLGLHMHWYSQESRIHLFWKSFKSYNISKNSMAICHSFGFAPGWARKWCAQSIIPMFQQCLCRLAPTVTHR